MPTSTDHEINVEFLLEKLKTSAPVNLSTLTKGRPKKANKASYEGQIKAILEEQSQLGKAYFFESGKKGEIRYWNRDEKHLVRESAIETASRPMSISQLVTAVGRVDKGADKAFLERCIRDLIGEDLLFEYADGKGGSKFCNSPPPPLIEQGKNKVAFDKLLLAIKSLGVSAKISIGDLLIRIREHLGDRAADNQELREQTFTQLDVSESSNRPNSGLELKDLIVKEIDNSAVVSLAELRDSMPAEFQGEIFDKTVLQLADENILCFHGDAEPSSFTEEQRRRYVQEGSHLYTAITKRG